MADTYAFNAELWLWDGGTASWTFITVPPDVADEIEDSVPMKGGFGSVKVEVTIGSSTWQTSLFPSKERETYVLPIKKSVRVAESIGDGDHADVSLVIVDGQPNSRG